MRLRWLWATLLAAVGLFPLRSAANTPTVTFYQPNELRLELVYSLDKQRQPIGHTTTEATLLAKRNLPSELLDRPYRTIAVLPGNFHHPQTLWPGGLLIIRDQSLYQPPLQTKRDRHGRTHQIANRPALAQSVSGKVTIMTAARAWHERANIRVAFEAGPFLVVDGKEWHDFSGFLDSNLFRAEAARRLVGITTDGAIFFWHDYGSLGAVRSRVCTAIPTVKTLMNLDGGTSLSSPNLRLPVRLVAFQISPAPAQTESHELSESDIQPTPVPIPSLTPIFNPFFSWFSTE